MASKRALGRARALVGTAFRPQGRDPMRGLDCVGLVICAFRLARFRLPDDYRLSSPQREGELRAVVGRHFRQVRRGEPGNLVLMRLGADQWHLGVVSPVGIIHADARRRVVVESAFPDEVREVAFFRQRRRPVQEERG